MGRDMCEVYIFDKQGSAWLEHEILRRRTGELWCLVTLSSTVFQCLLKFVSIEPVILS